MTTHVLVCPATTLGPVSPPDRPTSACVQTVTAGTTVRNPSPGNDLVTPVPVTMAARVQCYRREATSVCVHQENKGTGVRMVWDLPEAAESTIAHMCTIYTVVV